MKAGLSAFGRLARFRKPSIHGIAISEEEIEAMDRMYEELEAEEKETTLAEQKSLGQEK